MFPAPTTPLRWAVSPAPTPRWAVSPAPTPACPRSVPCSWAAHRHGPWCRVPPNGTAPRPRAVSPRCRVPALPCPRAAPRGATQATGPRSKKGWRTVGEGAAPRIAHPGKWARWQPRHRAGLADRGAWRIEQSVRSWSRGRHPPVERVPRAGQKWGRQWRGVSLRLENVGALPKPSRRKHGSTLPQAAQPGAGGGGRNRWGIGRPVGSFRGTC